MRYVVLTAILFLCMPLAAQAATITWGGGGADNNWSTCANWVGGVCPGSGDTVVFNSTSVKNATVDASFAGTITALQINTGYTGTVSLGENLTISGSGNAVTQSAGTLDISGHTLTLSGNAGGVNWTGGTIVSTNGTTTFSNSGSTSFTQHLTCTGTFPGIVDPGTGVDTFQLDSGCAATLAQTISKAGSITLAGDATVPSGSTITISGNASGLSVTGSLTGLASLGTTTFSNSGSTSFTQHLTCTGTFPGIVDPGTGVDTFQLDSGCSATLPQTISKSGSITLAGNATVPSGSTITISGNASGLTVTGSLTGLASLGTTTFSSNTNSSFTQHLSCSGTFPGIVDPGSGGTTFQLDSGCSATLPQTISKTGNITLAGNATVPSGSTITISGNASGLSVTGSLTGLASLGTTTFSSNSNSSFTQHLTCTGTYPGIVDPGSGGTTFQLDSGCSANLAQTISKSGNITLAGDAALSSNSAVTLTSNSSSLSVTGSLNLNGHNLSESGGTFSISSSGTLKLNGNESITTPTLNSGSTVDYDGSGTYTSLPAGSTYDNLFFTGTGSWATSSDITITGNFTQTAGTFTHTGTLDLAGTRTLTTDSGTSLSNLTVGGGVSSLASGLNAYWKFDESAAGSTVVDSSGNGYNGTAHGSTDLPAPTSTPTVLFSDPYGLSFDGTDDSVDTSLPSVFNTIPSQDFSISFWFNTASVATISPWPRLFEAYKDSSDYVQVSRVGATLLLTVVSGGTQRSISTTGFVSANTWYHFVGTWNSSSDALAVYLDGVSESGSSNNSATGGGVVEAAIGDRGDNNASTYFKGAIDDMRIYNRVLSSAEISALSDGWSDSAQATTTLGATLMLSGNLTINSGSTLDASASGCSSASCNITLAGNWANSGTFTPRTGTVTFDGTNQSITGATTFYNLSKTVSAADTWTFPASTLQTIEGTWTATGASGNLLSLRSSSSGTQWSIDPQGTRTLSYLDVKDSDNTDATAIAVNASDSTDSGNNTNWSFTTPNSAPTTPTALGPSTYTSGGWTTTNTPTLTFTTSDPDNDTVQYEIQIADNSSFTSPAVDYTSAFATAGASSFTVGQAAGSGTYTAGSANQTLPDGSYYWRVKAGDTSYATSSWATANSGSIAFKLDATAPTAGAVTLSNITESSITATLAGASDAGSGLSATPYFWYESTLGTTTGATTTTSWTLSNLTANTAYHFSVGVTDSAGNTATTTIANGTTLAASNTNSNSATASTKDNNGPIFTGSIANLPGYVAPRLQVINPDGTIEYLDTSSADPQGAPSFSRDLELGDTGPDVTALQQFLNAQGFAVAQSGPGSSGQETTLFGALTKAALAQFQSAHGIAPASGYFGPLTRAAIADAGTSTSTAHAAFSFTRDLQLGDTGPDVTALQQFLNAQGFTIAQSGPGSPGQETAFFGAATRAALARYQAAHKITPAVGYFGVVTRGVVGE